MTFRRQESPQTFRVSTTRDAVLEENESFKVGFDLWRLQAPWPYTGEGSAVKVVPGPARSWTAHRR